MTQEEISLDRYFSAVWRAKWLIVVVVLLASATAWWLRERQPAQVQAAALLRIGRVWKEPLEDPYVTEAVLNSPGFFHDLAAKQGGHASHLKRRVHSEVVIAGTHKARYPILLSIVATSESSDDAVRLATAVSDEIIERHQQLFDEALDPYRKRAELIESQLKQAAGSRELQSKLELELNDVRVSNSSPAVTDKTRLVEPIVAETISKPGVIRGVATVALVAVLVSIVIAALAGHFTVSRSSKQ